MTPEEVVTTVENDYETELSRLGSSKALYAISAGDMTASVVVGVLASRAAASADLFHEWAGAESNAEADELFDSVMNLLNSQVSRIEDLADSDIEQTNTALHAYLEGLETTTERAGGLLAWLLVTENLYSQATGFFVGSQASDLADIFRELTDELPDQQNELTSVLESVCESDTDYESVHTTAAAAVEAAYEDYVESLESMGIDVKPIC